MNICTEYKLLRKTHKNNWKLRKLIKKIFKQIFIKIIIKFTTIFI